MLPSPETSRDQLILRLNEVYHDLENQAYDEKHPDILEDEIPRWQRIAADILAGTRPPVAALDVGCGTGFVPLQLREWLGPEDRLTCADLSTAMLTACRTNLEKAGLRCGLTMLKLDGRSIELPDRSLDLVTVNAVLHHLARPQDLCREIDRVLKPGGRVVVGHEPTRTHAASRFLVWNYRLLLPLVDPKLFVYEVILSLGLFEIMRGPLGRLVPELEHHNQLLRKVNDSLIASGHIREPLPAATLSSLLDVQSPTAGGLHHGRGFAREDFATYFPGYRIERFETYKHLGKINPRTGWLRKYEGWLAKRLPEAGSSLLCGLRKSET